MQKQKNIAVILAAGKGKRVGSSINKVLLPIKKKPLIYWTFSIFEKHPQINEVILVSREIDFFSFQKIIQKYHFKKIISITKGGKERQDSAMAGLKMTEKTGAKKGDLILFHNAANPLVSVEEISELIKVGKKCHTALLAQPLKDTLKKGNKNNFIIKTISRKNLWLAQTPQAIEYCLAKEAFNKAKDDGFYGTDDVSLVERLGKRVKIVPCSYKNIKVTTKDDFKIVENFL
ncbi:MAG TPA: 2-C-methyl-D-erythritol 4-phosphate cytidylyltransferase [Candidatus Pacearchaeota archaeon]|nr:2-C-methyl-D-erythritol 4-phosphate cytidylyltransferase [Candidatus Pacearchaeota archaeon]HPO75444.1 2-C-methyl-D-erythritol 4-phosphate cytidylyltransferase [Candidatus Pacearchaeota archaeon]